VPIVSWQNQVVNAHLPIIDTGRPYSATQGKAGMRTNAHEFNVTRRCMRLGVAVVIVVSLTGVARVASAAIPDPPSTYAGSHLTVQQATHHAYNAGFHTEKSLLAVVAIAIAESGLVTKARNWHPEFGYRPAAAKIGVQGPAAAWNRAHTRQLNSDRGMWQISSHSWPQYKDAQTDSPTTAAQIMFTISKHGTNFTPWDTYTSGNAQKYYDARHDGWPAIRPIIRAFLASVKK